VLSYIGDVSGNSFSYDARLFNYDYDLIKTPYENYLGKSAKKADIYKAIHIDKSTKTPDIWVKKSQAVSDALNSESMFDVVDWLDQVLDDVPVLIYAGEWDQRDGPTTVENYLANSKTQAKSATPIRTQTRQIYYIKQQDGTYTVGGYMKYDQNSKLTTLTMPKAGHFAPQTALQTTYQFLSDFINNNG